MKNIQREARRYHSVVFNLWEEGGVLPNAPPVWRFSLTNPHSGERIGFRSIEALFNFLQTWTYPPATPPTHSSEGDNYVEH